MKRRQTYPSQSRGRNNVTPYPISGKAPASKRAAVSRAGASSRTGREQKIPPFYIWGDFDVPFLLLTLALLGFGLVMLFSSSYAYAYYYKDSSFYYIKRQMIYSVVAVVAMIGASFFNYQWLRKFVWPIYFVAIILCVICYFFDPYQGARRWIYIAGFSFQPSEIGKFAIIMLVSHYISRDLKRMGHLWEGILRNMLILAPMALVVVMQPHLSATILLIGITGALMIAGGSRIQQIVGIGGVGLTALATAIFIFRDKVAEKFSHVIVRLTYWLEPFATNDAGAYQTQQSLKAIGSGGLLGMGLGESRQKHLYLPEVQNDFIFAVACEELGFVGACIIIILFAMLIWRGYTIAMHARDPFGMLVAVGITTQIGLQAMLNIAVVTNTVPNTGISLPLFSYGGTSLCMIMGELGILLGISRQANYEKE